MDWKEVRARDLLRRKWANDNAIKKTAHDKEAERRRNPSEDTKIRMEIQKSIRDMCYGKNLSKEKVLQQLNEKYGDFKYLKYRQYFESWVNNVLGIKENKAKNGTDSNNIQKNYENNEQER